jgi:hypothetical protein
MTLVSEAVVSLEPAERYLGQLVKHFGHRLPTALEEGRGSITFSFGTCTLVAEGATLRLRLKAPDAEDLGQLERVVKEHLERFAFRTNPEITWVRDPV